MTKKEKIKIIAKEALPSSRVFFVILTINVFVMAFNIYYDRSNNS